MKTIYKDHLIPACRFMASSGSILQKLILLVIFVTWLSNAGAKTYYLAPNGNDNNPGTINSPFKNWQKLSNLLVAGDIAYIRGGTYLPSSPPSLYIQCLISNLNGNSANWITIQNYPGERPVFDYTGFVITNTDAWALYFENCSYLKIKGLRVTGLAQSLGGIGVSRGINIVSSNNILFEQVEVDHMGGTGFLTSHSNNVTYLNCDSHHNADPYSTTSAPWGGADGFGGGGGETSTNTVYDGCRAWWNSDDGFDFFGTNGVRTLKNCWAFWNGYQPGNFLTAGNGEGYKLGPTANDQSNNILKFLNNCTAFENRMNGFSQNAGQCRYQIYNCTSYKNGRSGFWWGWYPGIIQNFKNNIGFANPSGNMDHAGQATGSNNSWNGGPAVSNYDFLSLSSVGVDGPRQANGNLPNLNFLKLAQGSPLIDAGTNVGLPFVGMAPDKGFDEFGAIALPIHDVALTGNTDNGKHQLNWSIIADEPIRTINIETSADAVNYQLLTTVSPAANTYTYQPNTNGTLFYRLKVTSVIDQTVYSNILALKNTGAGEVSFNVSTFVHSEITVNTSVNYKYILTDVNGRTIETGNGIKGFNRININKQPAGMYFLQLISIDTTSGLPDRKETKKIVKQ